MSVRSLFSFAIILLIAPYVSAQKNHWQFGIGSSVFATNYDLVIAKGAIKTNPLLRSGLGIYTSYRLNKKGRFQWGPFNERLGIYIQTGSSIDLLAYSYYINDKEITHQYISVELPLHLLLMGESGGWYSLRKKGISGYGRFGITTGWIPEKQIKTSSDFHSEITSLGGIRTSLHLGGGFARKLKQNAYSTIGVYSKIGLKRVAKGQLNLESSKTYSFSVLNFQAGLECYYFFGQKAKSRNPKDMKPAILCPRF